MLSWLYRCALFCSEKSITENDSDASCDIVTKGENLRHDYMFQKKIISDQMIE